MPLQAIKEKQRKESELLEKKMESVAAARKANEAGPAQTLYVPDSEGNQVGPSEQEKPPAASRKPDPADAPLLSFNLGLKEGQLAGYENTTKPKHLPGAPPEAEAAYW